MKFCKAYPVSCTLPFMTLLLTPCLVLLSFHPHPCPFTLFFRGYSGKKLSDNVQCEIFQTILEEARESYSDKIVHELSSNFPEDIERNVDAICQYVIEWTPS